jgi:hypothetical protein
MELANVVVVLGLLVLLIYGFLYGFDDGTEE